MPNRQLDKAIADLRAAAVQLPEMYRAELAAAAAPYVGAVQSAVLTTPSEGTTPYHQPPGLRARIAATVLTWSKIRGEIILVGVEVAADQMPSGQKSLPLYLNGNKAPWRHPLFGLRGPGQWITQPSYPFFDAATASVPAVTRQAVEAVTEQVAQKLSA